MEQCIEKFNEKYNLVAYDSDSDSCDNELNNKCNNSLPMLPAIEIDPIESNAEKAQPIEINGMELAHKLTNVVRSQYLKFLSNLLESNYASCNNSSKSLDEINIVHCAEELEQKALRSCMIVSLYRKSMLKIIAEIRHNTKQQKLFPLFDKTEKQKKAFSNVSVQTRKPPDKRFVRTQTDLFDIRTTITAAANGQKITKNVRTQTDSQHLYDFDYQENPPLNATKVVKTLDEKIRRFEMTLKEEERKRKQFSNFVQRKEIEEKKREKYAKKMKFISPTTTMLSPNFLVDHQPHQQKSMIMYNDPLPTIPIETSTPSTNNDHGNKFYPPIPSALLTPLPTSKCDEDTIANELQALFGADDNIDDIFAESTINNTQIDAIIEEIHNSDVGSTTNIDDEATIKIEKTIIIPSLSNDDDILSNKHEPESTEIEIDYKRELKESLWPCELHMQKMRLRRVMDSLADKGLRHNEKIQIRFYELFGDDDDDAFQAYSPTLELDEILLASCKKRIAPWIVKFLMRPMTDGLIANRFLFKKLAKHIAHDIIMDNQYPEEYHIRTAVTNYFCEHPYIGTINDIN